MLAKSGDKTNQSTLQDGYYFTRKSYKTFQQQMSLSNNLFKDGHIFKISDSINCKNAPFVRDSLRRENLHIFNTFTPLGLNHTHKSSSSYPSEKNYSLWNLKTIKTS